MSLSKCFITDVSGMRCNEYFIKRLNAMDIETPCKGERKNQGRSFYKDLRTLQETGNLCLKNKTMDFSADAFTKR